MNIRLAGVLNSTCVNGEGVRMAIFVQGCPHHCPGCHNPDTHDMHGGYSIDTDDLIQVIWRKRKYLDGITISGGEPFMQRDACTELARAAHDMGLNVWVYTGYTYDQLMLQPENDKLLKHVDVLVDGRFEQDKTPGGIWTGSSNQRVIKMCLGGAKGE